MDSNEKAVLQTVLYADIFDTPFDVNRLTRFILSSKRLSETPIQQSLHKLLKKNVLSKKGNYIYLSHRASQIEEKIPNMTLYAHKLLLARKAAHLLSVIGTVQFIGLSGALASGNVHEGEDIDFFVIARKNTLWITRLISIILLEMYGIRRRRRDAYGRDKICLNMFVSDETLMFPKERRDVYTAVEIAQMVPLFSRNDTYLRFLKANLWIHTFLPNFENVMYTTQKRLGVGSRFITSFPVVQLAKFVQILVMKKHKTTETVTDNLFAFHPKDYRSYVLSEYQKRLKAYHIL